jgi:LL-diaminopimelate aminotransferase
MISIEDLYASRIGGKDFIDKVENKNIRIESEEEYILDFGKEAGDRQIDEVIVKALYEGIKNNEKYGIEDLNKSCSAYLRVEQAVEVDYKKEVSICNGVKEALNLLPLAFINKDDYIIIGAPGCNVMANMTKWLGGKVYEYKLDKFNKYMIDFEDINEDILKKCKLLYLNYPNNPTGVVADRDFFKEVIKYAKKYNFIVVNDATYIDLCFDEKDKVSFLSMDGAKDVGVELYSFSQTFNMSEYKIGFMVGNKEVIKAYNEIKNTLGINRCSSLYKAASVALSNYERIVKENKDIYLRRHNIIKKVLENNGFKVDIPKAGLYLYVEVPKKCNGVTFESAQEFALWLMENENVVVAPYDNQGKYVRISMNFKALDEKEEQLMAQNLDKKLKKYKFEFK